MKILKLGVFLVLLLFPLIYSTTGKAQTDYYKQVMELWGNRQEEEKIMMLLNKIIENNPYFAGAYSMRGGMKHVMGDLKGSEDDYTKAIQLDPQIPIYYQSRGSLRMDIGDMEGSLSDLDKSIELDPDFPSGYNARARANEIIENWQGVIYDCTRLIELFPIDKFPNIDGIDYYRRGNAKYKLEDFEGACLDWEIAVNQKLRFCDYMEDALEKLKRYCDE